MDLLISIFVVIAVVAVLVWLIKLIPGVPPGLEILRTLAIAIVVIAGILKLWPLL